MQGMVVAAVVVVVSLFPGPLVPLLLGPTGLPARSRLRGAMVHGQVVQSRLSFILSWLVVSGFQDVLLTQAGCVPSQEANTTGMGL